MLPGFRWCDVRTHIFLFYLDCYLMENNNKKKNMQHEKINSDDFEIKFF